MLKKLSILMLLSMPILVSAQKISTWKVTAIQPDADTNNSTASYISGDTLYLPKNTFGKALKNIWDTDQKYPGKKPVVILTDDSFITQKQNNKINKQ